jgi:hypothetical protein
MMTQRSLGGIPQRCQRSQLPQTKAGLRWFRLIETMSHVSTPCKRSRERIGALLG